MDSSGVMSSEKRRSQDYIHTLLAPFVHTEGKSTLQRQREDSPDGDDEDVTSAYEGCLPSHRDRASYLQRIHSFSCVTWFAKPVWLCPQRCAAHGWENAGSDLLQCVTCRAYMNGRDASCKDPDVYDECCRRLESGLVKSHHQMCAWRTNPVPKTLMSVPLLPRTKAVHKFTNLTNKLLQFGNSLPMLPWQDLEEKGVNEACLCRLTQLTSWQEGQAGQAQELQVRTACILALFGWQPKSKVPPVLMCEECNREIGLWNFMSSCDVPNKIPALPSNDSQDTESSPAIPSNDSHDTESSPGSRNNTHSVTSTSPRENSDKMSSLLNSGPNTNTSPSENPESGLKASCSGVSLVDISLEDSVIKSDEPPQKKAKPEVVQKPVMDPLGQHQTWCPWVAHGPPVRSNSSTDEELGSDSLEDWPGWEKHIQHLLPELSPDKSIHTRARHSPRQENLRSIRHLLFDCVSPHVTKS